MEHDRRGDWFVTYTGRRFWPLDPREEDIDIDDIAHALALQARWNGHTTQFYSIASHSVACASVALAEYPKVPVIAQWALLHDAAEAYVSDVIRPLKRFMCFVTSPVDADPRGTAALVQPFKEIEDQVLCLIAHRFGLPWPMPSVVHTIDNRMLVTEGQALTRFRGQLHWTKEQPWVDTEPYAVQVHGVSPEMAESHFRRLFLLLFPEHVSQA